MVLFLSFLSHTSHVFAQSDPSGESYPTRTFAITNAHIVQAPGKVIENGTIILSNGLITAVGTNVSIPDDAEVIDGTDLFVYPGFIDGMSNTGAARPEQMERPDNLFTPDPPNDYAGITPEHSVLHQIDVSEKSIENLRKLGFTISHTVPYGRMLPGSGSLILLTNKETKDELVLKKDVSMFTQFSGVPRAYPGNTLGIMAKFRNLYRNATLSKQHETMYAENSTGLQRPTQDQVLQAFYPVIDQKKAVFYQTNSMLEARRAMKLQKELGFNLVLSDLEQGWFLYDDLKGSDATVMMSLNLPDAPKEIKDKSDEVDHLVNRRMEAYNQSLSQYSEMAEAGISFGFSTIGTTASKIKSNLVTLVDSGMTPDLALAALTINTAKILGIDNIAGSLEKGKLANAVVSTGSYFEKDSKVKFVFIDGDKYEYDTSKKAASEISEGATKAILGTWNFTIVSPQGLQTGQLIFTNEGESLVGVLKSDSGNPDTNANNISFQDGSLSFDFAYDAGGQLLDVVVSGEVSDNEFVGEAAISAMNLSIPMTATKEPK